MTDKADLIREIHEYVAAHGGENTATHLLVQAASVIQTQAAELESVGPGGVQVLSAAPAGFVPVAAFDRLHAHAESLAARLLAASPTPPAEQQAKGLPSGQEPKYTVDGNSVVNRHTGEAIPHDEPIFVFRARDALSVRALEAYLSLIGEREPSSAHAEAVRARIADFRRFANTHQSSMKWPDTATQTVKSEPLQQAAPKAEPMELNESAYQRGYLDGMAKGRREVEAASQPAPAPLSDDAVKDAAFEAVRKKLCALPRYSFVLDDDGLVRRAPDRTGNWIEFDEAHALFDPVSVDAAIAAQGGKV